MNRPQYILGITCFGKHESAVALTRDGKLVAATEEERFTRIKFDRSFPRHAISWCLQYKHISIDDIAYVGFSLQPWRTIVPRLHYFLKALPFSIRQSSLNRQILIDYLCVEKTFRRETTYHGPFLFLEHHLCHAASAFFSSPFRKSTIISVDGVGERTTCWTGYGDGTKLIPYKTTEWPHSLGHIYATVTQFLGFSPFRDEYKVMGLAAYGKSTYLDEFRQIIQINANGKFTIDERYVNYPASLDPLYSKRWVEVFKKPRKKNDSLSSRHKNIAASIQARLEEVLFSIVAHARAHFGKGSMCLVGGVALNSVAVGKIAQSGLCTRVYTSPVSSDAGCALGATQYIHNIVLGLPRSQSLRHAYWGRSFSKSEIVNALKRSHLIFRYLHHPEVTAADLIARKHIIGWFQGRSEYSQRALGNRSILADPRDQSMKDRVNNLVKHRESFRPFAPAVLKEYQHEYFHYTYAVPFMTEVHPIRSDKKNMIPAVRHVDGTARLQTVDHRSNPIFWRLIKAFHKITGIPMLLNTSFNESNEPIVDSPDDAIKTFLSTGIDDLFLGNYWVQKQH